MRRFNSIGGIFDEPPEFAPILHQLELEGKVHWIADYWCQGFLDGLRMAPEAWQPLLEDQHNVWMLLPILALGSEGGGELPDRDAGPETTDEATLDDLESSVVVISRYWRAQQKGALRQAATRPRSLRVGRNEPCPCGS